MYAVPAAALLALVVTLPVCLSAPVSLCLPKGIRDRRLTNSVAAQLALQTRLTTARPLPPRARPPLPPRPRSPLRPLLPQAAEAQQLRSDSTPPSFMSWTTLR